MTIRELLSDETKWSHTGGEEGKFCLVEATNECYPDWDERYSVTYPKLGAVIGSPRVADIIKFNDAETTTHAVILRVLDAAGV